jgi:hypothetical protein
MSLLDYALLGLGGLILVSVSLGLAWIAAIEFVLWRKRGRDARQITDELPPLGKVQLGETRRNRALIAYGPPPDNCCEAGAEVFPEPCPWHGQPFQERLIG